MWFVGLFEGEGTFSFANGIAKHMAIQMTDLDTLHKVQQICGGKVRPTKKSKEHFKDCWIWYLQGEAALLLAEKIQPYLMARRKKRCDEFCASKRKHSLAARREHAIFKKNIAQSLRKQGWTHKQIAEEIGVERSYISHLLGKKYMVDGATVG